ncbi:MAG: DEAD/DEAH box helicase family protein [Bacteroidota bacterium]|jgi:hypothetical protein
MFNAQFVSSYASRRLQSLDLTIQDGFLECFHTGDILIHYKHITGDLVTYDKPENNRKTLSIETPDKWLNKANYICRRLAPDRCQPDKKYHRPTGQGARPFFTRQTIDLYNTDSFCDFVVFGEGEIKMSYANKYFGTHAGCIGFPGISNYKLCAQTKEFLREKKPLHQVVSYDTEQYKKPGAFFSSAFEMFLELFTFAEAENIKTKFHICRPHPELNLKAVDDVLFDYGNQAALDFLFGIEKNESSKYWITYEVTRQNLHSILCEFFNYKDFKYKNCSNTRIVKANYLNASGVKNYLSDIAEAEKLTIADLTNVIIQAPPSMGKTTLFRKIAKTEKIIYLAPQTNIIDQVYNDATGDGLDVMMYNGCKVTRQKLADRIKRNDLPGMIVSTLQSIGSLKRMLTDSVKNYHCVLDEFHLIYQNYLKDNVQFLMKIAPEFRTFTGMTGTMLNYNCIPFIADLKRLKFKISGTPKYRTELIKCNDDLFAAAKGFKNSIARGRTPYILFNNKKDGLNDLKDLLSNVQGIGFFNADNKDDANYQELIKTAILPDNITGVITTKVYQTGVNNNTVNDADLFIIGKHHPVDIEQTIKRFRLAKCNVYIIQPGLNEYIKPEFKQPAPLPERDRIISDVINQAIQICDLGNATSPGEDVLEIRTKIQNPYIFQDDAGIFQPDFISIQNAIFDKELYYYNSTPEVLLHELSKYSFDVWIDDARQNLRIRQEFQRRSDIEKVISKLQKALSKVAKNELFNTVLSELKNSHLPKIHARQKIDQATTPEVEKQFYDYFLTIEENCKSDAQAIELFSECKGKNAKVKMIIQRLTGRRADFNRSDLGKSMLSIIKTFQPGQEYTAGQLKDTFVECLKQDPTINIKEFTECRRIDKILKRLRIFYDVTPTGNGGEKYKIDDLPEIFVNG